MNARRTTPDARGWLRRPAWRRKRRRL